MYTITALPFPVRPPHTPRSPSIPPHKYTQPLASHKKGTAQGGGSSTAANSSASNVFVACREAKAKLLEMRALLLRLDAAQVCEFFFGLCACVCMYALW